MPRQHIFHSQKEADEFEAAAEAELAASRLADAAALAADPEADEDDRAAAAAVVAAANKSRKKSSSKSRKATPVSTNNVIVALESADTSKDGSNESSSNKRDPKPKQPPKRKHHGIKNKSAKATTVSKGRPRTHKQRDALKKPGATPSIFTYLSLPPGRPKKTEDETTAVAVTANSVEADAAAPRPPPKKRGTYGKWDKDEFHKRAKDVVVTNLIQTGDVSSAIKAVEQSHPTIKVPRQTALSWLKKIQEDARKKANKDDADMLAAFDRDADPTAELLDSNRARSLTTPADREFLQSIMVAHDLRNSGMSRKEAISIIANLGGVNLVTAENHFDYLIRSKQLPKLKNNGRVLTAQQTTTNRTAVTTEKLLRTHMSQTEGKVLFCSIH